LGGRDKEDGNLKPAWTNSLKIPFTKNPSPQGEGPEFKPQYRKFTVKIKTKQWHVK
jgi:hypothetical protein